MFFKKSCSLVLCSFSLMAQDQVWIGTSNSYSTASNWNPSGTPTVTSNLYFSNSTLNQPLLDGGTNYAKSLNFNVNTALSGDQNIFVNQIKVNAPVDIGLGNNNSIYLADFYQTDPLLVQLADTLTINYTTIANQLDRRSFSFEKSTSAIASPLLFLKGATINIPSNNDPSYKPVVTFAQVQVRLTKDAASYPSRIKAAQSYNNKVISTGASFEAPLANEGNELFQWVDLLANNTTINLAPGNALGPLQINGANNNITVSNDFTIQGVGANTPIQGDSTLTKSNLNVGGKNITVLGKFNLIDSIFENFNGSWKIGSNVAGSNGQAYISSSTVAAASITTEAASSAQAAVSELAATVSKLIASLKAQITALTNLVIIIQKKVKAVDLLKASYLQEDPSAYGLIATTPEFILKAGSQMLLYPSSGGVGLVVNDGNLIIESGVTLNLEPPLDGDIAKGFVVSKVNNGSIVGDFTNVNIDPWYGAAGYQLFQNGNTLALVADNISLTSLANTSNNKEVADAVNILFGLPNTSSCLKDDFFELIVLPSKDLNIVLDQLEPSEFKDQQIAMEEMIFNINDEASELLYTPHSGYRPFIFGGYNYLHQGSYSQYAGYRSRAGYEMAGFSYGTTKWQVLASLGALQTSTLYREVPSNSSSGSIIANVGSAGFAGRWSFGLDGLFSYDYLHTKRGINFYNVKASSSHNGLHLKGQFHGSYLKKYSDFSLKPYDDLAYLYGYEGSYTEYGAGCLNLHLASSHRNMIRNTLGLRFELVHNEHVRPFIDVSYVFEYRFNGRHYNAYFVGTNQDMKVQGLNPPKNMGKLLFGVTGSFGLWDYQLKVTGQAGHRFYDLGAAAYLDRRF